MTPLAQKRLPPGPADRHWQPGVDKRTDDVDPVHVPNIGQRLAKEAAHLRIEPGIVPPTRAEVPLRGRLVECVEQRGIAIRQQAIDDALQQALARTVLRLLPHALRLPPPAGGPANPPFRRPI